MEFLSTARRRDGRAAASAHGEPGSRKSNLPTRPVDPLPFSCEDVDPQEFDWPEPEAVYHVPSFSADVPLGSALCLRCRRIVWLDTWLRNERCPASEGSAT